MNQFKTAKKLFQEQTQYERPLTYEEWLCTKDEYKVGLLFVQFFDQITLAWRKIKTDAAIEEECLSESLRYLLKNVYGVSIRDMNKKHRILEEIKELKSNLYDIHIQMKSNLSTARRNTLNRKKLRLQEKLNQLTQQDLSIYDLPKFNPVVSKIQESTYTPEYIYRMAYNAMYCLSIDRKYPQKEGALNWYNSTIPNITSSTDGEELDLFDTIVTEEDDLSSGLSYKDFWNIIEDTDKDTKTVVECILMNKRLPQSVQPKEQMIMNKLREMLKEYNNR